MHTISQKLLALLKQQGVLQRSVWTIVRNRLNKSFTDSYWVRVAQEKAGKPRLHRDLEKTLKEVCLEKGIPERDLILIHRDTPEEAMETLVGFNSDDVEKETRKAILKIDLLETTFDGYVHVLTVIVPMLKRNPDLRVRILVLDPKSQWTQNLKPKASAESMEDLLAAIKSYQVQFGERLQVRTYSSYPAIWMRVADDRIFFRHLIPLKSHLFPLGWAGTSRAERLQVFLQHFEDLWEEQSINKPAVASPTEVNAAGSPLFFRVVYAHLQQIIHLELSIDPSTKTFSTVHTKSGDTFRGSVQVLGHFLVLQGTAQTRDKTRPLQITAKLGFYELETLPNFCGFMVSGDKEGNLRSRMVVFERKLTPSASPFKPQIQCPDLTLFSHLTDLEAVLPVLNIRSVETEGQRPFLRPAPEVLNLSGVYRVWTRSADDPKLRVGHFHLPESGLVRSADQDGGYSTGKLSRFSRREFTLNLRGTDIERAVWSFILKIPTGNPPWLHGVFSAASVFNLHLAGRVFIHKISDEPEDSLPPCFACEPSREMISQWARPWVTELMVSLGIPDAPNQNGN